MYYHCTGNLVGCPKPYVREETLTDFFSSLLEGISLPSEILEWISQELSRERREERLGKDDAGLLKRLENLYLDKLEGDLSAET